MQIWAYDKHKRILMDEYRNRCDFGELGRATKSFARRYRWAPIIIEEAAMGHALIRELTDKQRIRVEAITPRGSKVSRFRRHVAKILDGRIEINLEALFAPDFVDELVRFPRGRQTDQVDAFTQAMDWIDANPPSGKPPAVESPGLAVIGLHSSWQFPAAPNRPVDPKAPGLIAGGCHSVWSPNSPFPQSRGRL